MANRKLLEQVTDIARFKHLSLRTEETYRNWIKRFIHKDVRTTMIYTHVLNRVGRGVRSSLDA
jgi:hypothetical protein